MPPRTRSSDPQARRIRAALGFALDRQPAIAKRVGISDRELSRWGNSSDGPTNPRDLDALAEACGVPTWFLRHGFSPPIETGELELRDALDQQQRRIDELEDLIATQIARAGAPFPRGELGRRLQARLPRNGDRQQLDSDPGTGAQTDTGQ